MATATPEALGKRFSAGAVTAMQLGNGGWESTEFNSRLQPTQIALGATPNATNLLKLDYEYGASDSVNNGNITKQTITVPTVGSNNGFVATQTYSYDSLNRLKQATENITPNGGSATQSWKQTFTFDRYGNRRFDLANGNTTFPDPNCPEAICNPTISTSNNRLTSNGWSYDSAGNTTNDPEGRQFMYDAENKQTEVRDQFNTVIGQYSYDGDGKRVKKVVPSTGETTVFVYDASGKLVAEYSTQVEPIETARVAYLTADHLGSPRINTDANGAVTSRHDYLPFGEEITSGTGGRTTAQGYDGQDSIRQKFTGYERDAETDLDFAQARMYNKNHGRFTTTDPIYFQREMIVDPQRFNLYVYTRNNPLKWLDPSGEKVRIAQGSSMDQIYESVGGQAIFDEYFEVKDGLVSCKTGADCSKGNQGVQFLNQLVGRDDSFLVYLGADADAVAKMFAGTTNEDGSLNDAGKKIKEKFLKEGSIVGTNGRPLSDQPNGDVFTVLAINPATYNYNQIGVGSYGVETETLQTGVGQRVRPVSLLLHELAENLDFSINGTGAGNPAPDKKLYKKKATRALYQQQYNLHIGAVDYERAHKSAIRREIQIRRDLSTINGGFAGGLLKQN